MKLVKTLSQYLSSRSLQAKFLAINVPLVLLATLTLFSIFEYRTYRDAIQGLHQDLANLIATQSAALANPLWNLDDVQIQLTLAAIATNADVVGVRVLDETGAIFDETGIAGIDIPDSNLSGGEDAPSDGEVNQIVNIPETDLIVGRTKIVFEDGDERRTIGELVIVVTDQRVWQATRNRFVFAGILGLIVVASAVLSALFAHRRTIGIPLERLLASITKSQSGGTRDPVQWQSQDEMGAVVSAFNDMQRRQETDEKALRAARDHLEQRVEERTQELATAHEVATGARDQAMHAQIQLSDAIESISEGFSLYDSDDRLVICNSRYRDIMYPGLEAVLEVGTPFEVIARRSFELGLVGGVDCSIEEWLKDRLEQHRNPKGPHIQKRSGERWIQINERKTEDGSTVAIYTDLSELMRAEQAMRESEERLRAFYNNSPFEIFLKDREGRHILVNRKFEEVSGMKEEEIIGKTTAEIFPEEYAKPAMEQDRAVLESGQAISVETERPTSNGVRTTVIEKFPVPSADGGIAGVGGIVTDITDRKERERQLADLVKELQIARDEAEAANQAKSAFLATMSHEIRTPMNSVVGMTSLLLNTEQTLEQKEFTEIIRNSSDALLTIINDILDFSKIEAGKMELERQTFEVRDCIQGALDLLAGKAAEKHIELAYIIQPGTPEAIVGDISRLRQILVNLLNNALKFTEVGEVVLTVDIDAVTDNGTAANNQILRFSVSDTGVGISPEQKDRLFKPFSQIDASISRRHGGTGLGLAICRRLCELMGGRMWAESEEGKGSIFHFTIDVQTADSSEYSYLHEIQPNLQLKDILLIENNQTSKEILSKQITYWGLTPHATPSAHQALDWIKKGRTYDVVIVDRYSQDIDAVEFGFALKKLSKDPKPPIVLITALGEQAADMNEFAFDAVISKPIKPSQLFDVLVNISAGTSISPSMREQDSVPSFDESMGKNYPLRILLTEDNTNNQKLALLVLNRLGYRADVAGNGIEALEALDRQAYDVVLMDVQMPEMDGLEATRQIRAKWSNGRTPWIVAMTANAMQGDREMCLAAGMNDYVTKPIRIEEVTQSLKHSWREIHCDSPESSAPSDQSVSLTKHAATEQTPSTKSSILDPAAISRLEQLADGDRDFLVEFIDAFLSGAPKLLNDINRSLETGNSDDLRLAAHTLKSNSAALGATHLSEICKELEDFGREDELSNAPDRFVQLQSEFKPIETELLSLRDTYSH